MRPLLLLVPLALLAPALAPPAAAGVCAELVCVGYTVVSSDCRVGAIEVNGVFIRDPAGGGFLIGEVWWRVCGDGYTSSGHSIEALSQGWYDMTWNGERSCSVSTSAASVPTDCALGPPSLPILV
ncbi:MAG TPA: hypothetical protein VM370_09275 [Candidatus Thermoplasmatota archaeon]|nr:hypothetical protein [Candidatus Thermoplasmatota archaeon]